MNTKQILGIILPFLFIISFMTSYRNNILLFSETLFGKLFYVCCILFYAEMDLTYGFLALLFIVFYYKIFFPQNAVSPLIKSSTGLVTPAKKETKTTKNII
jgi:hypothetical protein